MMNWLLFFLLFISFVRCRSVEPVPIVVPPDPVTASQASLVSVQATGATSAEVIVKAIRTESNGWRLTARNTGGQVVTLTPATAIPVRKDSWLPVLFSLTSLTATGLVAGQTYQFRLDFLLAGRDSVTALRSYTHRPDPLPTERGLRWTRLAHAAFDGGDYTGCPVAVDGICDPNPMNGCGNPAMGAFLGNQVQLLRYAGPNAATMQLWYYDRASDSWPQFPGFIYGPPRRQMIQYNLYYQNVDRHYFVGLGYQTEERAPSKYFFYRDMLAIFPDRNKASAVLPPYEGEDGEVVFFTTTDEAYFLTQNGSPAMRSIDAIFTQTIRAPLPEPPGTLATFSIRNVGYVVNQRPGQPTRLWAYNPATDSWTKRADFPGDARQRGSAFALARKGYFGLGLSPDGRGLRDLWQYDPVTDRWRYVTDYPGQGNQFLAVFSAPDGAKPERAYMGWGYEAQLTDKGFNRVVGCTDWWELTP